MKVLSVVGARPQFVKLAPIAHACARAGVEHVIVHTGQHYDPMLSDVFFQDLNIPAPDEHLGVGSGSHGHQTGAMLAAMDDVLLKHQPDWVLVYGDTNSTIAAALSAVKLHFPVAHLEAGLRSFNREMPEEHNRVLTDHCADLLLSPTEVGAQHLAAEGLKDRTVVVGDVMTDVLFATRDAVKDKPSPITEELGFQPGEYSLATIHRPANTDSKEQLEAVLDSLGQVDHPVVIVAHPRLVAKAKEHGLTIERGNLHTHSPLAYPDLVAAAMHARGIITDSGGLQKEAFLLRVPTTTVRTETEWVETVNLGWNVLVGPGEELVAAAQRPRPADTEEAPYGDGHAADEVVRVLIERAVQK
ncbi:UDP-N-acetylglucosamine 2-epimerase [Boudabousia liubingyangii]|uniref:UDP-N-acetylglucosamine 2-epimerase n=1 Tax=Boudabousia liubingyangii TaxID=1921764 RepID=A0A1Q5PPS0_9ACTO|nr:UDP-N-acetylglucosamine 2-epimerase (non-hydrolyzing) [Boudabousia liubingyangii]OKL48437.1 UDP-N-acetylglucosamine 2-epimerase [Boudabousia liubingyangii]OKL49537.1 UDP-N-acetylglucosamine 2-epimerase [Boudabousia liubingyangii]